MAPASNLDLPAQLTQSKYNISYAKQGEENGIVSQPDTIFHPSDKAVCLNVRNLECGDNAVIFGEVPNCTSCNRRFDDQTTLDRHLFWHQYGFM